MGVTKVQINSLLAICAIMGLSAMYMWQVIPILFSHPAMAGEDELLAAATGGPIVIAFKSIEFSIKHFTQRGHENGST